MPPELASHDATDAVEQANLLPAADNWDRLPDYATLLTARHEAHADTFEQMVADLPLHEGETAVDIAIGDGFYTELLARRNPSGRTIGLDVDLEFLSLAETVYVEPPAALVLGDATELPFADASVDLVWCAHSLRSLPDAKAAVCEWARVTRPGGHIAILENDRLHEVLLPWPPEVELALYHAECRSDDANCERGLGGLHAGRRLHRLAEECGLELIGKRSYATDATPPTDADRAFLKLHLAALVDRVRPQLTDADWNAAAEFVDPEGPHYLVTDPALEMTFFDSVAVMRRV